MMSEERRKLKRKYLVFFTRVFDRNSGQWFGNLADLSPEGLMLISEKPLPTGLDFSLSMDLPLDIFGTDRMDFDAHSIWCQPDIDPNFYNTGFKFADIAAQDAKIIQQIIEVYGIREDR